jgi:hypothetical protein
MKTLALGVLVLSQSFLQAQTFAGYSATLTDYWDCDPSASACDPKATALVKVLPTGESSRDTRAPGGGMASHILLIRTKTAQFQSYPETGRYFSLPARVQPQRPQADPQCAAAAPKTAVFVNEELVAKAQAFRYDMTQPEGRHNTIWLFPDAGCAALQSINDFGSSKTWQWLTSLVPGFNDTSILQPRGIESSPLEMFHDGFLRWYQTGATPNLSAADADAKWQAVMSDPGSSPYKSFMSAQTNWQKSHALQPAPTAPPK